ncbi:MAG: hypothetical protein PUD26_02210, partial [bacterium]|nr:hypothetical protein [bacterium]
CSSFVSKRFLLKIWLKGNIRNRIDKIIKCEKCRGGENCGWSLMSLEDAFIEEIIAVNRCFL